MFGLDDRIAGLGTGETLLIVLAVALLLGLRHATDPDHLTAVTTLVAGEEHGGARSRSAARLGLAWGGGHATTLFGFGLPIVLYGAYLPAPVQAAAETVVGLVIIALAARLLVRWRRGALSPRPHHPHARDGSAIATRSPLQAYAIGLVHGVGGSAGVGVLLLAAIPDHVAGVLALAVFALFTAVSMAIASTSFGWALSRERVLRGYTALAPALGLASLAFGVWYALGALDAVPYGF
jgi:cytochrome c biogenesis protein CcdA